jgi:aminoglycoside phosphotransferase family enzyme
MSWLFLTEDEVYKLKKPVRFPYLDFSTLELRRAACIAELLLNRRLAPDVYERVAPLTRHGNELAIDAVGDVVDWLVVMRRLDERHTLERLLLTRCLALQQLNPLIAVLARFYRHAAKAVVSPASYIDRPAVPSVPRASGRSCKGSSIRMSPRRSWRRRAVRAW